MRSGGPAPLNPAALGDGTAARPRAEHPGHVWALDFQFDETAQHRRLKLPDVIDEHAREALAIHVDHNIDADRVVEVVERIAARRGAPKRLRMDNGPEPTAYAANHRTGQPTITTDQHS